MNATQSARRQVAEAEGQSNALLGIGMLFLSASVAPSGPAGTGLMCPGDHRLPSGDRWDAS